MKQQPLRDSISWLLGSALARVSLSVTEVALQYDLTERQAKILCALDSQTPQSIRSLRDQIDCDAASATGILDRLERRNLVERKADPNDRRVTAILLTPTGIEVQRALRVRMAMAEQELLKVLEHNERGQLAALLKRIS